MKQDFEDEISDKESSFTTSSESILMTKKDNYKALFWGQLLDTLKRTIDQLYSACEADESEVECKEIIMMLSYGIRDFQSLIDKMEILKAECSSDRRPLAWDERKMSIDSPCLFPGNSPHRSPRYASLNSPKFQQNDAYQLADTANKKSRTPTNRFCGIEFEDDEDDDIDLNIDSDETQAAPGEIASVYPSADEMSDDQNVINKISGIGETLVDKIAKTRVQKEKKFKKCKFLYENIPVVVANKKNIIMNKNEDYFNNIPLYDDDDDSNAFVPITTAKTAQVKLVMCSRHHHCNTGSGHCSVEQGSLFLTDDQDLNCSNSNTICLCSGQSNNFCLLCSLTGNIIYPSSSLTSSVSTNIKSRIPGRTVEIHEKLLSRQKNHNSSRKELEAKQARADVLRRQHLVEKTSRLQDFSKKVEQAKQARIKEHSLWSKRRSQLHSRLSAAEAKRRAQLDMKVNRAHDEETKGREIAFIQSLEAEQKQHIILMKHQESQARLLEREEKRRKRLERKQELEEAAKLRRSEMEAKRKAKLDARIEKWKCQTDTAVTKSASLKQLAIEKQQYRLEKIANLEAQQRSNFEELRSKIEKKHLNSERRYHEQLKEISRKAFEMSVLAYTTPNDCSGETPPLEDSCRGSWLPNHEHYAQRKWCRVCHVMIESDLSLNSHLQGWRHRNVVRNALNIDAGLTDLRQFNLNHLVDAEPHQMSSRTLAINERRKVMRSLVKRLIQRMQKGGKNFLENYDGQNEIDEIGQNFPQKQKLISLIKEVRQYLKMPSQGPWIAKRVSAFEKNLNSINRIINSSEVKLQDRPPDLVLSKCHIAARICVRLGLLTNLIKVIIFFRSYRQSIVPEKTLILACSLMRNLIEFTNEAVIFMLRSNYLALLISILMERFNPSFSLQMVNEQLSVDQNLSINKNRAILPVVCIVDNQVTIDIIRCVTLLMLSLKKAYEYSVSNPERNLMEFKIPEDRDLFMNQLVYCMKIGFIDELSHFLSSNDNSITLANSFLCPSIDKISDLTSSDSMSLSIWRSKQYQVIASKCIVNLNHSILEFLINFVDHLVMLSPQTSLESYSSLSTDQLWMKDNKYFLIRIMQDSDMLGTVSLLYSLVYQQKNRDKEPNDHFRSMDMIMLASLRLLNKLTDLSNESVQKLLTEEVVCLELRHTISHIFRMFLDQILSQSSVSNLSCTNPQTGDTSMKPNNKKQNSDSKVSLPTGARRVMAKSLFSTKEKTTSTPSRITSLKQTFDSWTFLYSLIWNGSNTRNEVEMARDSFSLLTDQELRNWLMVESVVLLGRVTALNEELQNSLAQAGYPPTLLQRLSRLPSVLESSNEFSPMCQIQLLYPTMISCCFKNLINTLLLAQNFSLQKLIAFIEKTMTQNKTEAHDRFAFESRFPSDKLIEVKEWFSSPDLEKMSWPITQEKL